MKKLITLENVSKTFCDEVHHKAHILEKINLDIREGEIFVFLGPSGSGKSTILRLITGLDKDYTGTIHIDPSIAPQDIGFVFQQFALLPWLTVFQNIELWLIARKMPAAERKIKVEEALDLLKLRGAEHLYPHQISGGMRQRVGIARALAIEPKIIFMDEPFSELDSFTADTLRKELLEIWAKRKMTIVMVTHILPEAIELADRIAVLTASPAHIEKVLDNHMSRPRALRSPDFFKLEDELYGLVKS